MSPSPTLEVRNQNAAGVLRELAQNPWQTVVRKWNWKSALFSALFRGAIFFTVNRRAGMDAALRAMTTEIVLWGIISGWYGAITQAFRRVEPAWQGAVVVMVMLPAFSHVLELAINRARGTPRLLASMVVSIAFTGLSTLFNWYAMRRGVLLVGDEKQSLANDLRLLPQVIYDFITELPRRLWSRL